jgi:SAM-dependent methyltransferase
MGAIPADDFFWEIHRDLPREGPGDNASTRRALAAAGLASAPAILDVGCGPGMQTVELARATMGQVIAVDTHQPFLAETARRAAAAGLGRRVLAVRASMAAMPFAGASFDAIWCEGAIYVLGLTAALRGWRRLLRRGGCIAATHLCWLREEIPDGARTLWNDDAATVTTIDANLAAIAGTGFTTVDHFVLPAAAWWDDYYTPMERRLASLRARHAAEPAALRRIPESEEEIEGFRCYGYVFFVMRPGLA